ncbi:MAG: sigma-70 family RNA polymerase sigma factor [Lachnospiraceae bacterium]|nr:sigma-70 family RNA polymerase sigma factor [Lachnospiraceae bacterium]
MLPVFMTIESPEDRELFSRLYTEHARLMASVAKHILNDWAEAEDAVHDVFVKLMDSPEQIRRIPEENRRAFLIVCVQNRARNILKKRKPVLELEIAEAMEAAGYEESEDPDLLVRLREEMEKLSGEQQEILGLHYFLGLKFEDVGRLMNKKTATVQKMSKRLTKTLRERMEGDAK